MMLKNVKMPMSVGGGTKSSSLKSALRRGFTIMELVIVIAVIAVLAAVLIPTFANLTQRANESADTQTVKNLNTILSSEEVLGNKAENMTEAIEIASSGGYNVTALTPTSDGNDILWNQDTNRFVLADSETGELVYADEQVDNPEISATGNYAYWKITDSDTNVEDGKYSYYLSDSFVDNDITVTTGIDVGENTDINITYQTTASQSVIFNTNGGTLTIDAANSDVKHYGTAEATNITAVKGKSYELYGTVQTLEINSGRVYVAAGSVITTLYAAPSENATVLVDAAESADITAVVKGSGNVTISDTVSSSSDVVESSDDTNKFAGGTGMPSSPFIISTADQFLNINKIESTAGYYYKLDNEIDLTNITDTADIASATETYKVFINSLANSTIDGDGNTIKINSAALFYNFTDSTLKNVTVEMSGDDCTIAYGYSGKDTHVYNAVFENVVTTGTVNFTDRNAGLYVIYAGYGNANLTGEVTFINCTNKANIYGQGEQTRYNAIFVGYAWGSVKLNFENCSNEGLLYCGKAALFLGNQASKDNIVTLNIENFKNDGTVYSFYQGGNYTQNDYIAAAAGDTQVITVDGVSKTLSDDFDVKVNQISATANIELVYNEDGTFTLTSKASNVETYKVTYATYVNWWELSNDGATYKFAGTQIIYIEEEISSADFADGKYTTELKWLDLATSGMKGKGETGKIGEYETVTIDGKEYYLIKDTETDRYNKQDSKQSPVAKDELEEHTIAAGKDINVVGYDADGHLVAGTYYKMS